MLFTKAPAQFWYAMQIGKIVFHQKLGEIQMTDEHELAKTYLSVIINPGKSLAETTGEFIKICKV